jgi:Ca2+-binding RTX toxin-like protein
LAGGPGNDLYVFNAGLPLGKDTILDKGGNDTLDFSSTTTIGVTIDLSKATPQNVGDGTLTLSPANAVENVIGGAMDDVLTGSKLVNRLEGGGGNDVLAGGAGNDVYAFNADLLLGSDTITETSGGGTDTLDFSSTATAGVTVDLSRTDPQTVVFGKLVLTLSAGDAIENVGGGGGDDVLIGNALANVLKGGPGNDTYRFDPSQPLGTDTVTELPGGGTDTLDFSAATVGVTVNLATKGKQKAVPNNLVLILSAGNAVENVLGGSGDDVLIGNALGNTLNGGLGNDILLGGAGNDTLVGGPANGDGQDILFGGSGQDALHGAGGQDLLFGGNTAYHKEKTGAADLAALKAIMAEWKSTHSYEDRVTNLLNGGGLNKKYKLKGKVLADSAADELWGEGEQDWFLVHTEDSTPDFDPAETKTAL